MFAYKSLAIIVIFCINFLIRISQSSTIENNISSLIKDVLDNDNKPTNLFVHNCWPNLMKLEFMKKTRVQVIFINDLMYQLPGELSPDNVMFVVDLDCHWADDFVNGVRTIHYTNFSY